MFIQSTPVPSRESAFGDPLSAGLGPTLSATRVHSLSRSNTLHHPQLHSVLHSTASPMDTFNQHILIESLLVTYLLPAPQNTCPPGYQPLLRSQIIPPSLGSPAACSSTLRMQTAGLCKSSQVLSAVRCDHGFLFSSVLQAILALPETAPILLCTALRSCLGVGKRPLFCWIYSCSEKLC